MDARYPAREGYEHNLEYDMDAHLDNMPTERFYTSSTAYLYTPGMYLVSCFATMQSRSFHPRHSSRIQEVRSQLQYLHELL